MTVKEKDELVMYINYLQAKGQESHRISRKPGLAQYNAGFNSGCSYARETVADELMKFIEYTEVER